MKTEIAAIKDILDGSDCIHVYTHAYPDGDAMASLAAMDRFLRDLGKQAVCRCDTPVAEMYRWFELNVENDRSLPTPDAIVTLDCGQLQQLGDLYQFVAGDFQTVPVINIDHHYRTTDLYGTVNVVLKAPSTTAILYDLFVQWPVAIGEQLASFLLYGLIADTAFFRGIDTTSKSFRIAADLAEHGAHPFLIAEKIHKSKSAKALQFWAEVLGSLRLYHDGQIAVASIERDLLERYEMQDYELNLDGLVNFMTAVETSRITVLLKQRGDEIRISFRSDYFASPDENGEWQIVDVAQIARQFGGGGHIAASGCSIKEPLEKAESLVLQACMDALDTPSSRLTLQTTRSAQ